MKPIKAKIDFSANGEWYIAGEELKGLSYENVVLLNEKGFIEPLSIKDLKEYKEYIKNQNKKEGGIINGSIIS